MAKVSTNIGLDPELKRASQELYAELGMDLTTAITIFLKQSLRVHGIPFTVTTDTPRISNSDAIRAYYEDSIYGNRHFGSGSEVPTAAGMLKEYADISLIEKEKRAWAEAAVRKHE